MLHYATEWLFLRHISKWLFSTNENENEAWPIPHLQDAPCPPRREIPSNVRCYVAYSYWDTESAQFLSAPHRQEREKLNISPDSLRLALYLYIETVGYGK